MISNTASATCFDDLGARVVVLVDAVAEAHQPAVPLLHLLDELRHALDVADLGQHPQDRLVGAAVERPVERRCRARERAVRVDLARADRAHRVGAAVLLVVCVEDEQHLQRTFERGLGVVARLRNIIERKLAVKARLLSGYTYGRPRLCRYD